MRPVVSLVEARPESVTEDYRRALALAGLDRVPDVGTWSLVAGLDGAGWQPGRTCPPWQVGGVLAALDASAMPSARAASGLAAGGANRTVAAVGPAGLQAWPSAAPWDSAVGPSSIRDAAAVRGAPIPVRPQAALTALEATGAAPTVPFALRHQPILALAAADLVSPWSLEGACATLGRLVLGGHPGRRGVPEADVRADTVALLRELFPAIGAVLDGTLWHVGPRGRVVARHVVIAGDDPVAVDALALRLAGYGPREVPWLRLCAERGLGAVDTTDMRVTGHTDLLALDFALPEPTFARRAFKGAVGRWLARPRAAGSRSGGPWRALYDDLRAGSGHPDVR